MVCKHTLSGGRLSMLPHAAGPLPGEGATRRPARFLASFSLVFGIFLSLAGCKPPPPEMAAPPPPVVTVSSPLEQDVIDYNQFTGRTAAVDTVKVRARVW